MSKAAYDNRDHSKKPIDISTPGKGPKLGWLGNLIIWGTIFVFMIGSFYFRFSLTWIFYFVFCVVLACAGWIFWVIAVRRGMFTWMRLAHKPAKLIARGDAEGAENACRAALERARRFAPNDHRRGMMLCELAGYVKNQGRYAEAVALFEESIDILSQHLASDPMDYAIALNNYAICFIHLRDYAAAQRILEKVLDFMLAMRKREQGGTILITVHQAQAIEFVLHMNLAYLFIEMNELDESALRLKAADDMLPLLAKGFRASMHDHYLGMCALWEYASGRFAEAEMEIADTKNKDDSACLRVRAKLHLVSQEYAEAERLLNMHRDLEGRKGALHRPEMLDDAIDLAEILWGQGKVDEAFTELREARSLVEDFKLPRDPTWQQTMQTWVLRARENGRAELAEAIDNELQTIPAAGIEAITILERFRIRRPNSA